MAGWRSSCRKGLVASALLRLIASLAAAAMLLGSGGLMPPLSGEAFASWVQPYSLLPEPPATPPGRGHQATDTPIPTTVPTGDTATSVPPATATATGVPGATGTPVFPATATTEATASPTPGQATATSTPAGGSTAWPTSSATPPLATTLPTASPTGTPGDQTATPTPELMEPAENPQRPEPKRPEGALVREDRGGGAHSADGRAAVEVEARGLTADARIEVKRVAAYTPPPEDRRLIGGVYDFSAAHPSSEARISSFPKPLTISLTYRLEELEGAPESSLSIYRLDEETSTWESVASKVDRKGRVVTAKVDHFSQYSLQGKYVDPNEVGWGAPPNYQFDAPAYTVAGGPDNADFDTAGYATSVQPDNHDFETGDLTAWTVLSGTASVQSGGYNSSYYAQVVNGSLASSLFTVPSDAQTLKVWVRSDGQGSLVLADQNNNGLRQVYYNTGGAWQQYSFNVTSYRGTSIKFRVDDTPWVWDQRIDDLTLTRDIPDWECTSDSGYIASGGPFGPYAVNLNGQLTSSLFTVPTDAQTLRFWLWSDGQGSVVLADQNNTSLRQMYYNTSQAWIQYSFNVAAYRGTSIKLRLDDTSWTYQQRLDHVELVRDIPGWESPSDQPSITSEAGISGPHARAINAHLTSAPFTVPGNASKLRFWVWSNGQAAVALLNQAGSQLWSAYYNTGSAWQQYTIDVTGRRGTVVRLQLQDTPWASEQRIDQVETDSFGSLLGDGPVNTTTGNFLYGRHDAAIPGRGLGLSLSRSYNSMSGVSGLFGKGWSSNYSMSLAFNADNSIYLTYPDGRKVLYTRNGDGSYARPEGVYDTLAKNGDNSYTLTTRVQTRFNFSSVGRLTSIVDKNGNSLALSYTGGVLRSAADPSGRLLALSYGSGEDAQVLVTPTAVLPFTNADFEQGSYNNWTTTGTAFGSGPTSVAEAGKQGSYYANSYRATGDATTGTLTSVAFTAGRQLLFRINGGSNSSLLKVSLLLSDDTEVLAHTNTANTLELREVAWNTTPWEGQLVRIRVTDNSTGSWGQEGIDYVRAVYAPSGTVQATLGEGLSPFTNANFEGGSYLNWLATGTAFGVRPLTSGDLNREGYYYTNSYDPTASYTATGTLTSSYFTAGRSLSLRINGGNKPDTAYVCLVLPDGTEVLKTTHSAGTRTLDEVTWDTSSYQGEAVRVRLVDNATDSGGWIGADYVRVTYASSRVQQVTDPAGRVHGYTYDSSGNLVAYADPMGGTISYEYGPYGMIRITDQNGHLVVDNGYDVRGRVVEQVDAFGNVSSFSYDGANRTTTFTDQMDHSRVYGYDTSGRTVSVRDELAHTESYGYDANGNRNSVTDRDGNLFRYQYDAMGNVTWITDPMGAVSVFTYDAKNNQLTGTDPLNRITSFGYDANGNLTRITDTLGGESVLGYDGFGQLLSSADPMGNTTQYGYDQNGNRTLVTDRTNRTTVYSFDAAGRVLSRTDPLNHSTSFEYRPDDLLTKVTDPLGHWTGYGYDLVGNQTAVTDPKANTTLYQYDQADRLSQVVEAGGGITSYQYDLVGRRTAVTDAMASTIRYGFDAAGRLLLEADPANHSWLYSYSNGGRLLTREDANDVDTGYGYDGAGRLTRITYPVGEVTREYDAAGRLTSLADSTGTITYSYDPLDRLTSVAGPAPNSTVGYAYDSAGNRTRITYPDGKVVSYGYDGAARLTSVTDWSERTTSYGYDGAGRLVSASYPNGVTETRGYDEADRLVSLVAARGQTTLTSFTYSLDSAGLVASVQDLTGLESYGYDNLNRLTLVTYPEGVVQTYSYDAVGNRLTKVQRQDGQETTTTYQPDVTHRMTAAGGVSYGYDGNGNQTSRGTDSFSWDYENRMTGATVGAGSVSYGYRPDGLRHSRTEGGSTTTYVWDSGTPGAGVLQDGSYSYVYGLGLIAQVDASDNPTYFLANGLGSTEALANSSGEVVGSYKYDAFGAVRDQGETATTEYRFQGQQQDDLLDYLYQGKDYDPAIGRFVSERGSAGGVGDAFGLNKRGFARGNPVGHSQDSLFESECIKRTADGGVIFNIQCLDIVLRAAPGVGVRTPWGGYMPTSVLLAVEPPAGGGKEPAPNDAAGRIAASKKRGDDYRDRLVVVLRSMGLEAKPEVTFSTPLGRRRLDVVAWIKGKGSATNPLFALEAKTGGSRYTSLQRQKDQWLYEQQNIRVFLIRDKP